MWLQGNSKIIKSNQEIPVSRKCYESAWKRAHVCLLGWWFELANKSPRILAGELKILLGSCGRKESKTTIQCHQHHNKTDCKIYKKKPLLSHKLIHYLFFGNILRKWIYNEAFLAHIYQGCQYYESVLYVRLVPLLLPRHWAFVNSLVTMVICCH